MALEPIQPLAASATRLETEGAETLTRLATGASAEATVVAALRNGGVRLALLDLLFEGTPPVRSSSIADAGRATTAAQILPPDNTPATVRSGRLSPSPNLDPPAQPATPGRDARPASYATPTTPRAPGEPPAPQMGAPLQAGGAAAAPAQPDRAASKSTAPSPATRPSLAARQVFVDLPVAAGLKVGDTVRLTVVDTTPHLALRVEPAPTMRPALPQPTSAPNPASTAPPRAPPAAGIVADVPTISAPPAAQTSLAARPAPAAPNLGALPTPGPAAAIPQQGTTQRPLAVFFGPPVTPSVAAPVSATAADSAHDSVTLSQDAARAIAAVQGEAPPTPNTRPTLSMAAREALAQLLPRAAAGQASLAPLLADAQALLQSPAGAALPKPLAEALTRLVEQAPLDPKTLDAASLRRAVQDAGPFLEAKVASLAAAPALGASVAGMASAALSGDLKAILFVLRAALQTFAGGPVEGSMPQPDRPPPPRRGAPPVGQHGVEPLLPEDPEPRQAARHLASEVEAVLDRIRLQQAAALPDDTRPSTQIASGAPDRLVEIPLRLPGETPVMALSVGPDGRPTRPGEERGWHMRLSLDFADVGRIDGLVSVRGRRTSITLHATDGNTRALLENHLPELRDALVLADLDVEVIDLRDHPIPATEPVRTGSFLDRRS
jgi:hypothetical protein